MFLEIVTPEAVLFSAEVDSISAPGTSGNFQMLDNHAPIVSTLKEGTVHIHTHTQEHLELDDLRGLLIPHQDDDRLLTLKIKSGTLEMKDNKVILLAD